MPYRPYLGSYRISRSGTGTLALTASFTQAGTKATSAALGSLSQTVNLALAANLARAGSGSLALSAVLAEQGRKNIAAASGTITGTLVLAADGTKTTGMATALALAGALASAGTKATAADIALVLFAALSATGVASAVPVVPPTVFPRGGARVVGPAAARVKPIRKSGRARLTLLPFLAATGTAWDEDEDLALALLEVI